MNTTLFVTQALTCHMGTHHSTHCSNLIQTKRLSGREGGVLRESGWAWAIDCTSRMVITVMMSHRLLKGERER